MGRVQFPDWRGAHPRGFTRFAAGVDRDGLQLDTERGEVRLALVSGLGPQQVLQQLTDPALVASQIGGRGQVPDRGELSERAPSERVRPLNQLDLGCGGGDVDGVLRYVETLPR